ncbi:sugar kinase [Pedobacter gandavensis]|uniref:sugar kinase n=1 Tax=Pedobacter gandavensis TaxID=2679963 RepID=UPI002930FEA7|nr:sugar kinase [Pedobacter gandavensis]
MNATPLITCFGEILLRFNTQMGLRFIQSNAFNVHVAGAEANVAVLLARLGLDSRMVSKVPDNDLAEMALGELRKYGVNTNGIAKGGERMGTYYVENGNHIRPTQVIYDRSGSSFSQLKTGMIDWGKQLADTSLFHWSGIAAAVSAGAAEVCKEAIECAHQKGITISADFNYRRKLWNYGQDAKEVMPDLLRYCKVAVADLDSAAIYFGIKMKEGLSLRERFEYCFSFLKDKMPLLRTFAMSFRVVEGLNHVYFAGLAHEGQFYYSTIHTIPYVTDQIGTGDAFTAGLLYALSSGYGPEKMINWAAACGVMKQSIHGDWALISKAEIESFIQSGISTKINR